MTGESLVTPGVFALAASRPEGPEIRALLLDVLDWIFHHYWQLEIDLGKSIGAKMLAQHKHIGLTSVMIFLFLVVILALLKRSGNKLGELIVSAVFNAFNNVISYAFMLEKAGLGFVMIVVLSLLYVFMDLIVEYCHLPKLLVPALRITCTALIIGIVSAGMPVVSTVSKLTGMVMKRIVLGILFGIPAGFILFMLESAINSWG